MGVYPKYTTDSKCGHLQSYPSDSRSKHHVRHKIGLFRTINRFYVFDNDYTTQQEVGQEILNSKMELPKIISNSIHRQNNYPRKKHSTKEHQGGKF